MKKAGLIFACIALLVGTMAAQDWKGKGRFNGVVLDEAGAPIVGAKVKLLNVQANAGFDVVTDNEGRFTAAWLRFGAWNVDFEKFGYEIKQLSLSIAEVTKNPDIKVVLKKTAGLTLSEDLRKELLAANELFEKQDFQGALTGYTGILQKNPDAYVIYKNVGNCYFSLEQYDKAEEAYLKILEKDPQNADAMVLVGNTYANRNLNEKALEWYNKIEIDKITDSTVLLNVGNTFFNLGKIEDALKYLKQAVKINPNDLDALERLGVTYISNQNNAEAIAIFEAYLKIDPSSERATRIKGFLDYLKKK
jgi:tetratricopeptide (TPR) repeat protein